MRKNVASSWVRVQKAAVCLLLLGALAIGGCASRSGPIAFERRSYGEGLGLDACRVSVALSVDEVLRLGEAGDFGGDLEQDPEWATFSADLREGDELRLVTCSDYGAYFFASIRGGDVAARYQIMVLD